MKKNILLPLLFMTVMGALPAHAQKWSAPLKKKIEKIDQEFSGNLGVVIVNLADGSELNYQGQRSWYLASTTKVLIAISLLKEVEAGALKLDQKLTLQQSDFVDGTGPVIQAKPGDVFTVGQLLEHMMKNSDSTATDMIVRLMGEDRLNKRVQEISPGFGKITSILEVRYGAYSEMSSQAKNLTNMDFITLKKFKAEDRAAEFSKLVKEPISKFKKKTVDDAFEAYYLKGENSAKLQDFAQVLVKLQKGTYLNTDHQKMLLEYMQSMETGETRIKAGLADDLQFAQKTGTQIRRMCNVGIIQEPRTQKKVALAACAEKFSEPEAAEKAFQKLGQALAESALF